jgi:two-component system, sensor histidine kinase RegB
LGLNMTDFQPNTPRASPFAWAAAAGRDRGLEALFALRTIALAGQAGAILAAALLLGIQLAWGPMALVWLGLALLNIYTAWRIRSAAHGKGAEPAELSVQLIVDVAALTMQLLLSEGISNPFTVFYLLLVAAAAVLLPAHLASLIGLLTLVGLSVISVVNVPMLWPPELDAAFWTRMGSWVSLTLCIGMITGFVIELSRSARARDEALAKARETLLKQDRMVALGALAAGAAHELGTPLNTMTLLTQELEQAASTAGAREDAILLCAQLERCKQILARLTGTARETLTSTATTVDAAQWAMQVVRDYELLNPQSHVKLVVHSSALILADPLITQSLVTVLDNARQMSRAPVQVQLDVQGSSVRVEVTDRGPGFVESVLARFGEPFVSARSGGRGLGLYLAKSAMEHLGGALSAENRLVQGSVGGARVSLRIPIEKANGQHHNLTKEPNS